MRFWHIVQSEQNIYLILWLKQFYKKKEFWDFWREAIDM